ncbi:MAG TPA: sialate O-acetylesterase [Clostridia bacterium]|nr:sialate O-acetylesterase [Clostridia bacterium]
MTENQSKIRLPRLISDGMVIQRNAKVKVWGWAPAGETITVRFGGKAYGAAANADGEWQTVLYTGDAGGPHEMTIESGNGAERLTVKNLLLGDVWVCSGQSNMEMRMFSLRDVYPDEIAKAHNDSIRQLLVPIRYDFEKPQADLESGSWEALNPESILNFTAAGYFFAERLFERYHVPIGLINASQGGSPAEAWLSGDALVQFPDYHEMAQKLKDKNYINALNKKDQTDSENWHRHIDKADIGLAEGRKPFYAADYDTSDWRNAKIPSYWDEEGLGTIYGVVWFRKEIEIPFPLNGEPAKILFGNVIDEDTLYINGTMVGSMPMQYIPRKYDIPEGLLKEGKNTIAVRVVNSSARGGFYKGKPYELHIGDRVIDLSGEWQCKIGAQSEPAPEPVFVMWKPSGLYNGMLSPVINYAVKGVIWYQGESNTKKPEEYEELFRALIYDWRRKWGQGDFPFIYVQLPNFGERNGPSVGNWAALREAQRRTLDVPVTGMAVTIDIGEWNDVHPRNKKDVGNRLALAARKIAYGDETVIAFGPLFESAERDGCRIVLSFSHIGGGLVTGDGKRPGHFEIAGVDKVFLAAKASIEGDRVVVWADGVAKPVYARYAWADNPEGANLYNREGLPASPFTTEQVLENEMERAVKEYDGTGGRDK